MKKQPEKTKILLKAQIKIHPEIKQKIDKTTEIVSGILVGIIIILLLYLFIEVFFIPPKETTKPTEEYIKKFCEQHNMIPYGYTIEYNEEKTFLFIKHRIEEQAYIQCKKEYPEKITEIPPTTPECCYPETCPQATNNPKYCNCIYLTYCIKKGNEYLQWSYKIIGT